MLLLQAMKTKGIIIFALLIEFTLSVMAQKSKSCVVADAETHVPVREALIHTDNNHWARTDYRGYFSMPYKFDSAEVKKPGYLPTKIYLQQLPDTVFLIPAAEQLKEVQVYGTKKKMDTKFIDKTTAELMKASQGSGVSFDFAKVLDRRGRRDAKHKRKAEEITSEMKEKTWDEALDDAYREEKENTSK